MDYPDSDIFLLYMHTSMFLFIFYVGEGPLAYSIHHHLIRIKNRISGASKAAEPSNADPKIGLESKCHWTQGENGGAESLPKLTSFIESH
jgi:hypothetical protein